jgi:trimethylamine--corrinoid protein Co-methyltransferase
MPTVLRVLTDAQVDRIHEESLAVLARTGMRIDSALARRILGEAGAQVDERDRRVRFPRDLVERALAAAPRHFSLGGRRPGFELPMNAGACTLMPDGEMTTVWDPIGGVRRAPVPEDWVDATKLIDTLDEVGAYWRMVTSGMESDGGPGAAVAHWRQVHRLFSKHIQDEIATVDDARWLLELLVTVFGSREAVQRDHPFSVLFCPVSPLAMEADHTDAWLATAGWEIPIAIMPMPMMGSSAPTGLRSTIVSGNAEVLGAVVLVQAAHEGTPVIYAPALAAMEPRTGRWGGGGPEHSLLGAATTEMGRFYGLPVIASNGGTDHFVPGIQAAYERSLNWTLPVLSWPDVMIGPGSLGGASTLSLEQMLIDVEVYRMTRRLHEGIDTGRGEPDVAAALDEVGPVGDFLGRTATRDAVRGGEWYLPRLGYHGAFGQWEDAGRPDILAEARAKARAAIDAHEPIPFPDEVEAELARLERAARETRED